jgi:UDP-N-acetylmuramoylalanine--D-glutamate ligase
MKKIYRDVSEIRADNLKDQLLKAREKVVLDMLKIESHFELVKSYNGRIIINDCNAIDLNACMATIDQQHGNVLWIKYAPPIERDLSRLKKIVSKKVKSILCFGEGVENVYRTFEDQLELFIRIKDLEEGLNLAYKFSKEGDIILFSPGSPNYNYFESDLDWNQEFNIAIEKLTSK